MKKFLLAGASTLALMGFVSSANAQVAIDLDLAPVLGAIATGDLGGLYVNAAVNAAAVDGSVDITAAPLIAGLNASGVNANVQGSLATAIALGGIDIGADILPPIGADIGLDGLAIAAAGAAEVGLSIVGNRISSTGVLATTAIGSVNDGTVALGALSTRDFASVATDVTVGGSVDFNESAADSASNTSSTAARAAAATTSLLVDGADQTIASAVSDIQTSGPVAIIAANVSANLAAVDGSVNLTGATINDIAGSATTAIGAVNTGTISNGLPGSITIVAGQTSSTTNNNTTVTGGDD